MSAIGSHSPAFATSGTVDKQFFAGIDRRVPDAIHGWRIRMRQRSELMMLNGVELRELSFTGADANREMLKPFFWKSIDKNGR
jgi:uncharacterized protein YjiS (DUF1127 family)